MNFQARENGLQNWFHSSRKPPRNIAFDTRTEAFELIRSLIEGVRLVPVDGKLTVELRGNLAGILQLCTESEV